LKNPRSFLSFVPLFVIVMQAKVFQCS
jgi:hypothetical protein